MTSHNLNILYSKLAESISITDAMADAAERSYKSVGRHLDDDTSLGETDVYTQGSFALGTVIRPISGEDEDYDIDLVCEMEDAASAPASHIKKAVGRSLRGYRKDTEDEGKRCWTFQYDKFHMDVLPCSPDITHCSDDTAIRLTHKNPDGSYSDRYSNPKGYRDWFIAKAGRPYEVARSRASSTTSCSLEEVPEYSVKSPLQQAVQILKHHRNIMFAGRDDAPISIIITTLAARAYRNEQGTFDAIQGILSRMDQYVECRNGVYRIKNPVDEYENFADKWNDCPEKATAFHDWLAAARSDLVDTVLNTKGMDKLKEHLGSCMGNRQANAAFKEFGGTLKSRRENGKLFASAAGIAPLALHGEKAIPNHTFFGL